MKFKGALTEATLLKRHYRFLVEVALKNRKKRMLYCPNLGALKNCDVLGTRIWYSNANRLSQGYLDTWELTEVNGGWLVNINPNYAQLLVKEALELNEIEELKNFRFLRAPTNAHVNQNIELLFKESGEQCFIYTQAIFQVDDRNEAHFPEVSEESIAVIKNLMALKQMGHRSVLFYCIQHNGAQVLKLNESKHPTFKCVFEEALSKGVEVYAYKSNIGLREMNLGSKIPLLVSEDITSS